MSVFRPKFRDPKTGELKEAAVWWYSFTFAGRRYRESAKTESKTVAKQAEQKRAPSSSRIQRPDIQPRGTLQTVEAVACLPGGYRLKHRAVTFAEHALGHVKRHVGKAMLIEVTDKTVRAYQVSRLKEKASPKSINEEVGFLLRLLGDQGDAIRSKLRRERALKLKVPPTPGRAYSAQEQARMLDRALVSTMAARRATERQANGERLPAGERQGGSPTIYPALVLALNAGMRDAEIKRLTWAQIDLDKRFLTVGRAKTEAGEGRTIPLNDAVLAALLDHKKWYTQRFGTPRPEWYVFPGGARTPTDPTKPITTLKTAWNTVKKLAKVNGRWHDNRHTLITELCESGAGDQTIMDIAGHVSRQMLARYSHIRMEAKRAALAAVERAKKPAEPKPSQSDEKAVPAKVSK
jgi:integrase